MNLEQAVRNLIGKSKGEITDIERKILLLDTYYFLESENYHTHLENLEVLTETDYITLEREIEEYLDIEE